MVIDVAKKARIKLSCPDVKVLTNVCNDLVKMVDKTGVKHSGIICLPTKKMKVPVRKSVCGGGTETYEHWQMRVHKRFLDIYADEKILKKVMRLELPDNVYVEIELIE